MLVIYLVFLRGPRGRAISIKIASHQTAGEGGLRAKVGSSALGGLGKDLSVAGDTISIMGEVWASQPLICQWSVG